MSLQSYIVTRRRKTVGRSGELLIKYAQSGNVSQTESELGRVIKTKGMELGQELAVKALESAVSARQWRTVAYLADYLAETTATVGGNPALGGGRPVPLENGKKLTFETAMVGVPDTTLGGTARPNPYFALSSADRLAPFLTSNDVVTVEPTMAVEVVVEEGARVVARKEVVLRGGGFTKAFFARALRESAAFPEDASLVSLERVGKKWRARVVV